MNKQTFTSVFLKKCMFLLTVTSLHFTLIFAIYWWCLRVDWTSE